jgi:ATP-dependent RNA helicase DeaD
MTDPSPFDAVSPPLRAALEARGFTALTPIQEAVLDPELAGRDLRIFSQTGSGKTVAVGLGLAPELERAVASRKELVASGAPLPRGAHPFAIVIAPTRELAAQVAKELSWLYEPLGAEVVVVTGGSSVPKELQELRRGPMVVVGTPGRLLDHLGRGAIEPELVGVIVLDEADQMLDMGFKDELDQILGMMPAERRTLLLSATFPREVARLADRCQKDPVVAGTGRAGEVNQDIAHVVHLVLPEERDRAIANLLLLSPGERALVFVRTREGAAELADKLSDVGIPARAIHGDLEQRDRTRTLDAFRTGSVSTLIATDVAARGLDVPDVARVIQADPPNDAEVFTHRSGRTGRAGKKGTTISLVAPIARDHVLRLLRRAGVEATWSAAPSVAEVNAAVDERLLEELADATASAVDADPRVRALAERLLATHAPQELVTALLARATRAGACEPFEVTPILPPPVAPKKTRAELWAERRDAPRTTPPPRGRHEHGDRDEHGGDRAAREAPRHEGFVPFKVTWGARHGADPRRVLAMACRRGGVSGQDIGAIRVGDFASTFEVAAEVAEGFAESAARPDERDPRVRFERLDDGHRIPAARHGAKPPPRRHTESEPPPRFAPGARAFAPRDGDVFPGDRPFVPREDDAAQGKRPFVPRDGDARPGKRSFVPRGGDAHPGKRPFAPRGGDARGGDASPAGARPARGPRPAARDGERSGFAPPKRKGPPRRG